MNETTTPSKTLKPFMTVEARPAAQWRAWLAKHHDSEAEAWLIFQKRHTGRPTVAYEDAVDEALCFGWIDSANQPATKMRRLQEAIGLLAAGKKLGLRCPAWAPTSTRLSQEAEKSLTLELALISSSVRSTRRRPA